MILEWAGDIHMVKKRGRWRSDTSVRRYERSALAQKIWLELSVTGRRLCKLAAGKLQGALGRRITAVRPTQSGTIRSPFSSSSSVGPGESREPSSGDGILAMALTSSKAASETSLVEV